MRRPTRFGVLLVLATLATLLLGACSGGDDDGGDASSVTTAAPAADDSGNGGDSGDSGDSQASGSIPTECPVDAATVSAAIGTAAADPQVNTEGALACTYNVETGGIVLFQILPDGKITYDLAKSTAGDTAVAVDDLGEEAFFSDEAGDLSVLLEGDLIMTVTFGGGFEVAGGAQDAAVEIAKAALASL